MTDVLTRVCCVPDCFNSVRARNMCVRHYGNDYYQRTQANLENVPAVIPTEHTKQYLEQIGVLRHQGFSYRQIADQLMLKKSQVRAVCRMMGWVVVPTRRAI